MGAIAGLLWGWAVGLMIARFSSQGEQGRSLGGRLDRIERMTATATIPSIGVLEAEVTAH